MKQYGKIIIIYVQLTIKYKKIPLKSYKNKINESLL